MSLRKLFWQALGSLVCLMFALPALAQSTGGRIIGRVTDPTAAVVSGAKVTLTNEATGVSRTVETDPSGDYTLVPVPVGKYTVTIEHPGFKKNVHKGVTVELNQVLNLDTVLQLGERTEVVEVTGEAPLVDTTSTQLGAVVNERAVTGLPLSSRDTYQLLQLQPGVTSTGGTDLFFGSDQAGAVSVNGGRGRTNNFMVNGGDGNDLFVNAPAIQPSPDSIQEFRVLTNTMDAEYGRNSGSVINVVTKSGTNAWHGSVFEFFRNDALNAKGFFDPSVPALKQNQFGGTFGGPIKKDRTFLFVSYEGRRITQGFTTDPAVVPTAAERGFFPCPGVPAINCGDFSASPFDPGALLTSQTLLDILNNRALNTCRSDIGSIGGVLPLTVPVVPPFGVPWTQIFPSSAIPTSCFDPVAADLLQRFVPCPLADPTCMNPANLANNFQAIPIGHTRDDQLTVRFDHRISQNQNLTVYYYLLTGPNDRPFSHFESATPNVLPGFGTASDTTNQQLNVTHTWTLNPTMVNEFRFTYFREAQGKFMHPQHTNNVVDSCTAAAAAFCFTGATDTPGVIATTPPGPGGIGIFPNLGPGREGVPFITISGGFTIGNNFEGEIPQIGATFQWSDNVTKVWGKHTAKFGVDFRHQKFDQTLFFDVNGDYGYTGGGPNDTTNLFANYLLGLPDSYLQGSAQTSKYRTNSLYLYAQDSWKIKPNLTLNYGLRWELNTPFADSLHRVQTFRPGQATTTYPCLPAVCPAGSADALFPLGLVVTGDAGIQNGLTATYYKSFAPRIGIAWSPGKSGKTSIHAGFGIFYNPIEQLVLEQLGAEPPFGGSTFVGPDYFQAPFVLQDGTVIPNPFNGFLSPAPGTAIDWGRFRPILLFGQVPQNLRAQYTEQYNISVEREITKSMVLHVGYVGSQGHRLLGTHDLNFGNPQTCVDLHDMSVLNADPNIDCGPFFADSPFTIPMGYTLPPGGLHLPYGPTPVVTGATTANTITLVGLRPFSSPNCNPMTGTHCPADGVPVFSSIFSQDTVANSAYHSLQVSLEKRFSKGLQFEAAYTYSSARDNVSTFEELLNPLCPKCGWAPSLFDARHRFVFSYYWELPVPKYEGTKKVLLNGWAVSGITTFQSGFPIRILSSDDQELQFSFDFNLPGRPDLVAPFVTGDPRNNSFCARGTGPGTGRPCQTGTYAFDPNAPFAPAALGTGGTAPRTICCGAGVYNSDFSLQKDTKLGEKVNMQFRSEFFNIFNTTQFLNPDGNITDGSDFGRVKRARTPRQIQFALKFSF
jgi:hypothetical protein